MEVREGLRYCNRCGANLALERNAPPKLFGVIISISGVIAIIAVAALLVITFVVSEVLGKGNVSAETYLFLMVLTIAVFGIEALLIRQLSRLLSAYLETAGTASPAKIVREISPQQTIKELSEPLQTTNPIPETRATNPIEVEQMTRKFETDE
jgi:hypothetical protein